MVYLSQQEFENPRFPRASSIDEDRQYKHSIMFHVIKNIIKIIFVACILFAILYAERLYKFVKSPEGTKIITRYINV
jgi:hypothetical protein